MDNYHLSRLFDDDRIGARQNNEHYYQLENGQDSATDNEGVVTPTGSAWDEEFAEDIGFDEAYSDTDSSQYTPSGSLVFGDYTQTLSTPPGDEGHEVQIQTRPEAPPNTNPDSTANSSSPNFHQSVPPSYLVNLPQLFSSAAMAQGRRGAATASDAHADEDSPNSNTTDDDPVVDSPSENRPSRSNSTPWAPTIVDFVTATRELVREEWSRVYQSDPNYVPNPYDRSDGWDWEAMQNYTRFPHFVAPPAPD